MGIFSDEDLTELDRKMKDALDQRVRKTFLEGFKKGRNAANSKYMENDHAVFWILRWMLSVYGHDYENFKTDARNLGDALGKFVGLLKYHPTLVLDKGTQGASRLFVEVVDTLRKYPDKRYYEFIEKRVKRWAKNISKQIGSLNDVQKREYRYILGRV